MNKNFWFIEGQINEKEWVVASPPYSTKKEATKIVKTLDKRINYRIVKYIRGE